MIEKVSELKKGDVFRDWLLTHCSDKTNNIDSDVEVFKVYPTAHTVCLFKFKDESLAFVAKFFGEPSRDVPSTYDPGKVLLKEFNSLKRFEKAGLCKGRFRIINPIAMKKDYSHVLLTEFVEGTTLEKYFMEFVANPSEENVKEFLSKLGMVASFLRSLHKRTKSKKLDMNQEFRHMEHVLEKIRDKGALIEGEYEKIMALISRWKKIPLLSNFDSCSIHMDATMPHYVFHGNNKLTAIDFENTWKNANPMHDIGILGAEIKHNFFLHQINNFNVEVFINQLVRRYAKDSKMANKIKKVLPLFIGHGLLRITRLDWDYGYKRFLIERIIKELESVAKLE